MADHFKYFPSDEDVVTPWNARYTYPAQSNKATKMTGRIPPKNGNTFYPGQIIRLEFPAQGYVNTTNTTFEFDVYLQGPTNSSAWIVRFQNGIASIFNRVRLLYGSTPQEDIIQYNVLVRCLTEWTATNQMGQVDQTSISSGVGGYTYGGYAVTDGTTFSSYGASVNTRQRFIQGLQTNFGTTSGHLYPVSVPTTDSSAVPSGVTPSGLYSTKRYQVSLALGVMTQDKLIPCKWMASQLAIEITLEQANACIYQPLGAGTNTVGPTYAVGNVNMICETIEFDDEYDRQFMAGLEAGGVPIKFSTWHYFQFTTQASSSLQLQITERSRSVKGIFAVQRRNPPDFQYDSHACFYDTNGVTGSSSVGSTMQQYQFRIGNRFFPASPVQLSSNVGGQISNGGAEAYTELEKFLNIVGDYRLSSNTSVLNFAIPAITHLTATLFNEYDYSYLLSAWTSTGLPILADVAGTVIKWETDSVAGGIVNAGTTGNMPSGCFACAINFETSNGVEISGLNAEEQSDISFNVMWSKGQKGGFSIECFTYVDVMWVIRPNNYIDLIQ